MKVKILLKVSRTAEMINSIIDKQNGVKFPVRAFDDKPIHWKDECEF